ncbi:MAG: Teichoic acids export ATP-binding protein TagH [Verrucomicrobia bacterium ADurb.Bin018]|nr:MAG: Teichoic acids export ATP-binding protein TagH [Verrucomicrobia bacterium ADurb.Bin018]
MNPSLQSPVSSLQSNSDVLVRVEGVSKKFCLSLKKSLWYGLQDMGRELTGRRRGGVDGRRQTVDGRLETRDGRLETAAESLQSTVRSPQSNSLGLRPKEFWAVNNVSFELKRGECLGLIGRNGAGKTTLLKMLNGLIKPDAGRIEMRGRVGALIALGAGFNPILTGRENIYVNGSVLGLTKKEIDAKLDEIVDFAEIDDFIDTPVQNYSSGMAVRLGFAVASSLDPDILLVDEVLAVGDLGFRYKCFQRISALMDRAAVIFVSHDMASVSRLSSRVMLLGSGKVQMLSEDCPAVIQRYNSLFQRESLAETGTGDVEVTDIQIRPVGREDRADHLQHGEDVAVEFNVRFLSDEPEATVVINLLNQAGTQVAQCMSVRQGFKVLNRPETQRVRMILPNLPLNPGSYSLWVILARPGSLKTFSVHYDVCPFVVKGPHIGYVSVQPVLDWQIEVLK